MKILQLVTRRQYRGAEVFAAELSRMLSLKHEITFAGLYAAPSNALYVSGCDNVDLNGKKTFFDPVLLFKVVKLIKKIKPDIIQANGSDTLKYAVFAKRFVPGVKIVYRNISMVSAWSGKDSVKRKFNAWLFSKVDFVTSVGERSLNDLVSTYNIPAGRTKVIRRGIPAVSIDRNNARKEMNERFGIGDHEKILTHAGRFSPEKNHHFLVESFNKVLNDFPGVHLVFIGEGELLEEYRKKNTNPKIHFAGHHNNVQQLIAGADIFILGSKVEGVPGVILEAAMQGVPSVAVNVGGVSEVVVNGNTGLIVETHNSNEFASAVLKLLRNDVLRNKMGSSAEKMVKENYTLEKCTENFDELYSSLNSNGN